MTERAERVLTEEGRRRLVARSWTRESPPCWDAGKAEAFGELAPALFGLGTPKDGEALADEWWRAEDGTGVLGYGRLDEAWGDAEILMVVHPKHRARASAGSSSNSSSGRRWPGASPCCDGVRAVSARCDRSGVGGILTPVPPWRAAG